MLKTSSRAYKIAADFCAEAMRFRGDALLRPLAENVVREADAAAESGLKGIALQTEVASRVESAVLAVCKADTNMRENLWRAIGTGSLPFPAVLMAHREQELFAFIELATENLGDELKHPWEVVCDENDPRGKKMRLQIYVDPECRF